MNTQATPPENPITPKVIPNKPDAQEYANDYVFRGGGDEYYPNAQEQELIQDALIGFEEEFYPIIDALKAEVEKLKSEAISLQKACDQRAAHEYKLMGENEQLKADKTWQPIDKAPKDKTEVIVRVGKRICLGWYFAPSSQTYGWRDENGNAIHPTEFIPMPKTTGAA